MHPEIVLCHEGSCLQGSLRYPELLRPKWIQSSHNSLMDSEVPGANIRAPITPNGRIMQTRKRRPLGADEPCACTRPVRAFEKGLPLSRPTSPSARQRKGWILAPLNPLAWCPCATNNRYNSTWRLAKHYLSLSISTSCYQICTSVAEFLGLLVVTLPTPHGLWTVPWLSRGCRRGIYWSKRSTTSSLMVPDFLWFWRILASPVPITCHIQGQLWEKSTPSWRWLGSLRLCGYWKLSN